MGEYLWRRGVGTSVLDCDTLQNKFELQTRFYVYFRNNTIWKCKHSLIHHCRRTVMVSFNSKWIRLYDYCLSTRMNLQ